MCNKIGKGSAYRTEVFLGVDISHSWGTGTPVLASGDICPGFQIQGGSSHLSALLSDFDRFLRFTSGARPAKLLVVSMAAKSLLPTCFSITAGSESVLCK